MGTLKSFFSEQVIEAFGWAIFHSIWQVILLLIILLVALSFMKKYSARIRYFVAYSFLILVLVGSVVTGVKAYTYAVEKQNIKEQLLSSSEHMAFEIKSLIANDVRENSKPSTTNLKWLNIKSKIQSNFYIVFTLWVIGIIFFLIKMAGGMAYLQRLTRVKTLPLDEFWDEKLTQFTQRLNIQRKVVACQSYLANVPMVVGHLKPVILLPVNLLTGLNNQEIEAIIAHELAHIKRHDYLLNFLQSIIETLFFYHPAVWLMSRIIRDEREHSCDDIAVSITGDTLSYIKALASAQEFTLNNNYNAVAFAQSNSGLLTRVKRLKTINNMKNKVTEGFFAASLIFISLILLSFTYKGNKAITDPFDPIEASSKFNLPMADNFNAETFEAYKDTVRKKVRKRVKKAEKVPDEIETVIELALSEENDSISTAILVNVEEALKQIEWEELKKEMDEAKIEIKLAKKELEGLNLDSIIEEAMKEVEHEMIELNDSHKKVKVIHNNEIITDEEALEIAQQALKTAKISIESIQLDSIINGSVMMSLKVIEDLDIGKIVEDALRGITIEFDEESKEIQEKEFEKLEKELEELEGIE